MSDHIESNIPAEANAIPSAPDAIAAMNGMYPNDIAQPDMHVGVASENPGPYSNQEGTSSLALPFEGLHGLLSPSNDFLWYQSFTNGNMGEGSDVNEDNNWQIPQ
ncbi:hypothetical protein ACEPAH_5174 [Sanghuangporus vaninii]